MTQAKIVLVFFPFDDLSSTKVRPALCLTDPIGPHRHVVLAFITSSVMVAALPSDLVLNTADPDFAVTGLRVSSTIQLHRMMTVTTGIIRRELGRVSPHTWAEVEATLRLLFGL